MLKYNTSCLHPVIHSVSIILSIYIVSASSQAQPMDSVYLANYLQLQPCVSPPRTLGTPSHRAVDTILQVALGLWALAHHSLVMP